MQATPSDLCSQILSCHEANHHLEQKWLSFKSLSDDDNEIVSALFLHSQSDWLAWRIMACFAAQALYVHKKQDCKCLQSILIHVRWRTRARLIHGSSGSKMRCRGVVVVGGGGGGVDDALLAVPCLA